VIYVGIDDTDMPNMPGTNKLAKALASDLAQTYRCKLIVRHQLLEDPRVPCTSKNSAATIVLEPRNGAAIGLLIGRVRDFLRTRSVEGSDPGLCVTTTVAEPLVAFGKRCQRELVAQEEARRLAEQCDVFLEGLGGTEDGVIGALAAVGLFAQGDDGRVVQIGDWPDDLAGPQNIETLHARGVSVRCFQTGAPVTDGTVDVGKHLRPNYREKKIVLFARPATETCDTAACWQAVRLK